MIDSQTRRAIRVSTDETAGPYFRIPLSQLPLIREVLDRHQITYWPDSFAISLDGKPSVVVVNFSRSEDATKIQAILDDAV